MECVFLNTIDVTPILFMSSSDVLPCNLEDDNPILDCNGGMNTVQVFRIITLNFNSDELAEYAEPPKINVHVFPCSDALVSYYFC